MRVKNHSLRVSTNENGFSFETFYIEILDDLSDNERSEINVSPETNTRLHQTTNFRFSD